MQVLSQVIFKTRKPDIRSVRKLLHKSFIIEIFSGILIFRASVIISVEFWIKVLQQPFFKYFIVGVSNRLQKMKLLHFFVQDILLMVVWQCEAATPVYAPPHGPRQPKNMQHLYGLYECQWLRLKSWLCCFLFFIIGSKICIGFQKPASCCMFRQQVSYNWHCLY